MRRILILFLVFLSGVSGLIYEVVWHRYLAIILGAQAKATAVVLAVFLGGISLGYVCFGRWSRWKKWNLLRVYAYVELGMFAWALAFPFLFRAFRPLTYAIYGWIGLENLLVDVFISIVLIGVPTFLMGGTLPLLTKGVSEDLDEASQTHARIYGINTLGACVGSLLAGYWLIPEFGLMPANVIAAGLNGLVALVTYFVLAPRAQVNEPDEDVTPNQARKAKLEVQTLLLLGIGFLSGFCLLMLETMIIRLMGLSTGSSNYTFTLIVSIFIFSLGVGSLLVRKIGTFSPAHLFWNQLIVSVSYYLLYRSGDFWSYGVHRIRILFRDQEQFFLPFQFFLGLGFSALLIIPIGLAGLTLPLCFHLLKDRTETLGHRVGQLYGLNTVGCVMGSLIGGYFLLNYFNLDQLFKFCIFLSLISAAMAGFIYWRGGVARWERTAAATLALAVAALTSIAPLYTRERFTQPFRHPGPIENVSFKGPEAFGKFLSKTTKYLFFKDGPNTSFAVGASHYENKEVSRTIFVNGKSDGNTRGDFFTTVMLAHIPALLAPKLNRAAIIGFGTGTTIGTLALYPGLEKIDVVEISGTIADNRHYFDPYNGRVSENKLVEMHVMDAFRYFGGTRDKFDIIISEPSNPWVTGIENLYSQEFYAMAKARMNPEGLFVQWIHTYSFTDDLMRMVLATMQSEFGAVSVFQLKAGDLAIVASARPFDRGDLQRAQRRMQSYQAVQSALVDAGVNQIESVFALELSPPSLTKIVAQNAEIHTLEAPKLSDQAARAFFAGYSGRYHQLRRQFKDYFPSVNESLLADWTSGNLASLSVLENLRQTYCDHYVSQNTPLCEETMAAIAVRDPSNGALKSDKAPDARELASLAGYRRNLSGKFTKADLDESYYMFESYKKYYSPIALMPFQSFMDRFEKCVKVVSQGDTLYGECLLQKLLVLETLSMKGPEFKENVSLFLTWFEKVPSTVENYDKLKKARELLVQMVAKDRH